MHWRIVSVLTAAALLSACTNVISSPQREAGIRAVYLLDLGRHSHLAFERPDGGIVEYAYGEWRWYARMEDAWWRVPAVLLWPTQGTLGRREWPGPNAGTALRRVYGASAVLELPGDPGRVDDLLARLDREFARGRDRLVRNRVYGLDFVPWDRGYWLGNNSNHAVKDWLQAAGFEVRGSGVFADWKYANQGVRRTRSTRLRKSLPYSIFARLHRPGD